MSGRRKKRLKRKNKSKGPIEEVRGAAHVKGATFERASARGVSRLFSLEVCQTQEKKKKRFLIQGKNRTVTRIQGNNNNNNNSNHSNKLGASKAPRAFVYTADTANVRWGGEKQGCKRKKGFNNNNNRDTAANTHLKKKKEFPRLRTDLLRSIVTFRA